MENLIVIILSTIIAFGIFYQLLSLYIFNSKLKEYSKRGIKQKDVYPSISILKPIKGIDDNLEKNLDSFFNLDYPNYEIIFGLHSESDPALEIIRNLRTKYPEIKSKIEINDFKVGLNPKINNMYNMYPQTSGSYIFISDSNTEVSPNFLKELLSEFDDPEMGLVTATIRGIGAKNLSSLMENVHLNAFLSPSVFTAAEVTKISIVIGKSILIPKFLLEKIGGFESLKSYLAEDYMMGVKVEEMGYKIKTSPIFVNNINEKWTLKKFLNRHSRWAKMRAKIRLNTYLLESFSNPITTAFILSMFMHNLTGFGILLLIVLLKLSLDLAILKRMNSDILWYQTLIIPLKDLIIGLVWFVPFLNSEVSWRENNFRIQKDSLLKPILNEQ